MLIVIIEFTMWILNNPTKEEIQKEKENEYIININNWIRTINKELQETENYKKPKLKCMEEQDKRIKNNEEFEINYCEKIENIKKFNDLTEIKEKATNYQVAFSWLSNNNEKIELSSASTEVIKKDISINLKDYKLERALFVKKYALSLWFTEEQANYLIAQLHQENWAWNENIKGDHWCSVWLIQRNECARWKIPANTWQEQIKLFVNEIKTKYDICWNFRQAQVAWNNPSVIKTWSYKTRYFYRTEEIYRILFYS